jgi:hypothetical protein
MKRLAASAMLLLPLALAACSHPQPVYYGPPPPAIYNDVARQGYRDGYDAAMRDIRSNVPPDVDRHPRFRNPPVGAPLREDYRHGFRDGYQAAIHGGPGTGPAGY